MTLSITTLGALENWRAAAKRVALVPTMGALHAGHMALVKEAQARGDEVIVSIFVNPTQFGPNEDFSRYPRTTEQDLALLRDAGVAAAWLPDVATMYPQGGHASYDVGNIGTILEGAFRPGHFNGVATVVSRLFTQVKPDLAVFGLKDYQQFCVIERLVNDLKLELKLLGVPTVREADGLALSSRNRYLLAQERAIAPRLFAVMNESASRIRNGEDIATVLADGKAQLLAAGFRAVDYLDLREAGTLAPVTSPKTPSRLLAAAHLGTTRLIDNIEVG